MDPRQLGDRLFLGNHIKERAIHHDFSYSMGEHDASPTFQITSGVQEKR
jgi:hypothetical protein